MEKTCAILGRLAAWVACTPAPPLLYAACQKTRSMNRPSPYLGLVYQDGDTCPWWRLGTRRHAFPPGHVAVLSTRHGSSSAALQGRAGLWLCTFDLSGCAVFDDVDPDAAWGPVPVENHSGLIRAYQRVITRARVQRPTRTLRLKAALLDLFAVVLEEAQRPQSGGAPALGDEVEAALNHIHEHYDDPGLALPAIAGAAALSVPHFGRRFRAELGMTPMQYLRSVRLEQGRHLLRTTRLRVAEVARAVGYIDPLHFSRAFRKAMGASPRAWRRHLSGTP